VEQQDNKICIGSFHAPHGVRGQIRLASYTADPLAIFSYSPLTDEKGERTFVLKKHGETKKGFIVSVKEIENRNDAEILQGTDIYINRDQLPEVQEDDGEFYYADLHGLKVVDQNNIVIGEVYDIHNFGAGDILEVMPPKGKSFMMPFKDEFISEMDIKARFIKVIVPDGWLEQEKQSKEKSNK